MTRRYDLHTHSTASDGAYTPAELVRNAAEAGITDLALTDHDTLAGLREADEAAQVAGIQLIPAVEVSVTLMRKSIHIVGLGVDPANEVLRQGLAGIQKIRSERALEMGRRLAKCGFPGSYEAATAMAGEGMITRTHFARHLLNLNVIGTMQDAFDMYLGQGKPAYVPTDWAGLEDCVGWITGAGGVAVVAHPQRYKLTGSWMRQLLGAFKEAGGQGLEVVSGAGHPQDIETAAQQARRFDLLASQGSDFHSPEHFWVKLGKLPALPANLTPVWSLWND